MWYYGVNYKAPKNGENVSENVFAIPDFILLYNFVKFSKCMDKGKKMFVYLGGGASPGHRLDPQWNVIFAWKLCRWRCRNKTCVSYDS